MITTEGNKINVFSLMNDFIDVTFEIKGGKKKFDKAYKILENAVEDWFDEENEDAADTCYGDYFQHILDEAGIKYTATYNDRPEEDDSTLVIMNVSIFQKKNNFGCHTADDAKIEARNHFKDYKKVYNGDVMYELKEINLSTSICVEEFVYIPEAEFIFNMFQHGISKNIPKDYKGRSISPGDIIGIKYKFELNTRYYYCTSTGFYLCDPYRIRYLGF